VIDFWGVGYTVAERMGLLPAIHEAGYAVQEVRFVGDDGHRAGGFSTRVFERMTGSRFTSLPRGDLAQIIYRAIEGRVEALFGDSIAALEEHEDGVRVTFEHAAPRDFDLVVGADGLHSRVRALAFGDAAKRQLGYHVAACEAMGYRPRDELVYVSRTRPGRQVARFAPRDDRTLFLLVFMDEWMEGSEPCGDDEVKALLPRIFGESGWECPEIVDAMDGVEEVYFDTVSQTVMDAWSRGRVALIGDAAACVSLLAGGGTGLAMTEAYVLAGELHAAAGDHRRAFRRFEERLRPFIEAKQRSARKFASAFAPRTPLGVWVRNQVTRAFAVPVLADVPVGRDLRDGFDLPDHAM
jgi:2-polyprenyl-6-methoxyphenol hydroxylase-like FAD-dependent oxidoreductase